jgi:type IV pilus assembly protein PilE
MHKANIRSPHTSNTNHPSLSPTGIHAPPVGKLQSGFTLIEIMLSLALVGILASIAIPYLQEHLRTTQRTAAQAALMQLAAQAESHYSQHWTYQHFTLDSAIIDRVASHHEIAIALEGQHYALTATPLNTDRCGTLQLHHDGRTHAQAANCWR